MCLTKLIRGIFCHALLRYLFTSVSWDCPREGPLSFLFTLCFRKQQKSYRGTSAEEIGAEVQQIVVELTPVADYGVMRFGEVGHILTGTWLEKQLGQNSVPSRHLAFLRNVLEWLRTNRTI